MTKCPNLFSLTDRFRKLLRRERLLWVIADSFARLNVRFDTKTIRAVGHGGECAGGYVSGFADGMRWIPDNWRPRFLF